MFATLTAEKRRRMRIRNGFLLDNRRVILYKYSVFVLRHLIKNHLFKLYIWKLFIIFQNLNLNIQISFEQIPTQVDIKQIFFMIMIQ